jgi:hypothetical protein
MQSFRTLIHPSRPKCVWCKSSNLRLICWFFPACGTTTITDPPGCSTCDTDGRCTTCNVGYADVPVTADGTCPSKYTTDSFVSTTLLYICIRWAETSTFSIYPLHWVIIKIRKNNFYFVTLSQLFPKVLDLYSNINPDYTMHHSGCVICPKHWNHKKSKYLFSFFLFSMYC